MTTELSKPIICEGYLLKFTNLVKGYQYRWFVINNNLATLDYYEKEDHKYSLKPRGCISLIFADVCPSVEDSLTFIINAKTGNYFKLKAESTKERQQWTNHVRSAISYFNSNLQNGRYYIDTNGGLFTLRNSDEFKSFRSTSSLNVSNMSENNNDVNLFNNDEHNNNSIVDHSSEPNEIICFSNEPFKNANDLTAQMDDMYRLILKNINGLPTFAIGSRLTVYDKNLLITKATCAATIECLKYCVTLLRHRRLYHTRFANDKYETNTRNVLSNENLITFDSKNVTGSVNSLPAIINSEEKKMNDDDMDDRAIVSALSIDELNKTSKLDVISNKFPSTNNINPKFLLPIEGMDVEATNPIDLTQATEDLNCFEKIQSESDIICIGDNKSLLHHLISQIKLGMDLTKVTLPTFILEKRSLLEMFSDYMAHPDLFLSISEEKTPENRMKALFLWYITSFHAGRKSTLAKKPYNPIIGETFHCMWHVPNKDVIDEENMQCHHVHFSAEQVSHHPPITAFYVNCPTKKMRLNASIHTKSKFQGMSIVAQMEGKVVLSLDDHNEVYQFTLPNAHAKNILSIPKLELGDKVTITCSKTKYSASLVFHSKDENYGLEIFVNDDTENEALFGSSSIHKITGEIKDPDNKVLFKLSGDWNSILNIEDVKLNNVYTINVSDLQLFKKFVNPECLQKSHESRKLWHFVTDSLYSNDLDKATKSKKELESRQRQSENLRNSKKQQFPVKYFQSTLDGRWVFKQDLSHKTKQCC